MNFIEWLTQQQIEAPLKIPPPPDIRERAVITDATITYQLPRVESLWDWLRRHQVAVFVVVGALLLVSLRRKSY